MAHTVWQYDFPSVNGEAWGTFILRSDGYFSAVTDFGNYAHRWYHHGRDDFREFVLGVGPDYVVSKLTSQMYTQTVTTRRAAEKQCAAFCKVMLPRLREAIRAELALERAA